MIITRKLPSFSSSLPTLTLNGTQLDLVSSFKYLGVLTFFGPSTFVLFAQKLEKQPALYIALFINILLLVFSLDFILLLSFPTYCTALQSGHLLLLLIILEQFHYFSQKMCIRQWSTDYNSFLTSLHLPSLSSIDVPCPNYSLCTKLSISLFTFHPTSFTLLLVLLDLPAATIPLISLFPSVDYPLISPPSSPSPQLSGTPSLLILSYSLHLALLSNLPYIAGNFRMVQISVTYENLNLRRVRLYCASQTRTC